MQILGALVLAAYLASLLITGRWIVRGLVGMPDTPEDEITASLLAGLLPAFAIFILASAVASSAAIVVSIAVPILIGVALSGAARGRLIDLIPELPKSGRAAIGIAWILLIAQYGFECRTVLAAVARGDGVIYQDIIYHAGIARSLMMDGFPAHNLQFAGEYVGYHIFTHFIAAQIALVMGTSLPVVFTYVLTPLFFMLIAASINGFIEVLARGRTISTTVKVGIIYASVLSMFLFSGTPDPSIPLYLSHSYQLQIVSLVVIFLYLYKFHDRSINISTRSSVLIVLLAAQAVLIKGSSLPLIVAGFGAWIGIEAIRQRRLERSHLAIFATLVAVSIAVYIAFFHLPGYSPAADEIEMHESRLYSMHLVRKATEFLGNHWIVMTVPALFSILSYRLVLVFLPPITFGGAVGAAFMAGLVLYLVMEYGANYYVLPAVCITNVYVLTNAALHRDRMNRIAKAGILAAVVLSLYPISNAGFPTASLVLSRKAENYYPLTKEKRRLYEALEAMSSRESLIFTTAVSAARNGIPDNYYPAALTGRTFYLGGHRLKTQWFPGLQERVDFVRQFLPNSREDYRKLKDLGVDLVLIETADLDSTVLDNVRGAVAETSFYDVVFRNEAGMLLKPK